MDREVNLATKYSMKAPLSASSPVQMLGMLLLAPFPGQNGKWAIALIRDIIWGRECFM